MPDTILDTIHKLQGTTCGGLFMLYKTLENFKRKILRGVQIQYQDLTHITVASSRSREQEDVIILSSGLKEVTLMGHDDPI